MNADPMSRPASCRDLFDLRALSDRVQTIAEGRGDHVLALIVDRAFNVGLFLCALDHAD